jgi:hypothetical protein
MKNIHATECYLIHSGVYCTLLLHPHFLTASSFDIKADPVTQLKHCINQDLCKSGGLKIKAAIDQIKLDIENRELQSEVEMIAEI